MGLRRRGNKEPPGGLQPRHAPTAAGRDKGARKCMDVWMDASLARGSCKESGNRGHVWEQGATWWPAALARGSSNRQQKKGAC
eukprot:scaffold228342_cov19-Tisochrysis_lutea.AAC.1